MAPADVPQRPGTATGPAARECARWRGQRTDLVRGARTAAPQDDRDRALTAGLRAACDRGSSASPRLRPRCSAVRDRPEFARSSPCMRKWRCWLAGSSRKASGTSNTSATSTGSGVSVNGGSTQPTTGVTRNPVTVSYCGSSPRIATRSPAARPLRSPRAVRRARATRPRARPGRRETRSGRGDPAGPRALREETHQAAAAVDDGDQHGRRRGGALAAGEAEAIAHAARAVRCGARKARAIQAFWSAAAGKTAGARHPGRGRSGADCNRGSRLHRGVLLLAGDLQLRPVRIERIHASVRPRRLACLRFALAGAQEAGDRDQPPAHRHLAFHGARRKLRRDVSLPHGRHVARHERRRGRGKRVPRDRRPTPSRNGFYEWVDTIVKDNGKKDCSGQITDVGRKTTNYIRFDPAGQRFIVCRAESLEACSVRCAGRRRGHLAAARADAIMARAYEGQEWITNLMPVLALLAARSSSRSCFCASCDHVAAEGGAPPHRAAAAVYAPREEQEYLRLVAIGGPILPGGATPAAAKSASSHAGDARNLARDSQRHRPYCW